MSGGTGLDVRLPIGGLFALLGLILTGYGLATAGDAERYARSLSVNINLWWGIVMLVFGGIMLIGSIVGRRKAAVQTATATPEGQATEARERQRGLEG